MFLRYLCRDDQQVVIRAAPDALLLWRSETERSAGSTHPAGAVDVAELVELEVILRQIVIWWDKVRVDLIWSEDWLKTLQSNSNRELYIHSNERQREVNPPRNILVTFLPLIYN